MDEDAIADDDADEASEAGDGDGDEQSDGDGDGDGDEMAGNAYCDAVADWDFDWADHERQVIERINDIRAEGRDCGSEGEFPPAPALLTDDALLCAARVHAADMATRDFFDHDDPEGNGPADRLELAGFEGHMWFENIGAGYPTPDKLITGWLENESLCARILDPEFTAIGLGYAFGPTATYAHYWTLLLGG